MEPVFKYKMKVRDYELDIQKVVNNANYQHYYEVTRHEFLEECGTTFSELSSNGIDAVVSSITIKYRKSLVALDEFYCTVNLRKQGVRYYFDQKIIRVSDNQLCSEAVVEVVCLVNGKLSTPDSLDQIIGKHLSE